MAIKFSMYNYSVFFAALSPLFISTYLLLNSVFQGNLRGIIFLVGNALASAVGLLVKSAAKRKRGVLKYGDKYNQASDTDTLPPAHDFCDVFEPAHPSLKYYGLPSSHAVFFGYTLAYIQLGIQSNPNKPGIPFFILLSVLGGMDLFFRKASKCDGVMDIFAGLIIGGAMGAAWFFLVKYGWPDGKGEKMVYYAKDDINVEKCKLGKQKFVCKKN
jgi:membrane-associated phospholipid phosphatase